ncbi:MAG: RBBP9/YdeN family alpha/beta hydrolase [Luteibaculum sp.]
MAQAKFPDHFNYLLVPGYGGIEFKHWIRSWARILPNCHVLRQTNFQAPDCPLWMQALHNKLLSLTDKPTVIIAHSLGVCTSLHYLKKHKAEGIAALLLVAMPEPERHEFHDGTWKAFLPLPDSQIKQPARFVYSENDEYCTVSNSLEWAKKLNIEPVSAGESGHIGSSAALGEWEVGQNILIQLLKSME